MLRISARQGVLRVPGFFAIELSGFGSATVRWSLQRMLLIAIVAPLPQIHLERFPVLTFTGGKIVFTI